MGISVSQAQGPSGQYLGSGRTAQKARTRDALVAAARAELAAGRSVTIESAAAVSGISRSTAYRYFTNQRQLITAAHPHLEAGSLLPDPAPSDPAERLTLVITAHLTQVTLAWEGQLRAALQLALTHPTTNAPDDAGPSTLRQGRAIGWILEALDPLRSTHPHLDLSLLARAIRSAAGIEALIWLTDVGGLRRNRAVTVMTASALAILDRALNDPAWPALPGPRGRITRRPAAPPR